MKRLVCSLLILSILIPLCALTSEDLVSALNTSNTDIRKARDEVSQAMLDLKDAKAGYSPTVDLTVTGSYIANPIDPIRINLADYVDSSALGLSGPGNDYITVYNGQESMYYQFSVSVTQPIFTWGKLNNAVKLYQCVYDARVLQLEDAMEKTRTELDTRLAALHYLMEIKDVLEKQSEISSKLVELANQAYENGMMLKTDALGVKVQASQLEVAKSQVEQQIRLMQTAIMNLTGLSNIDFEKLEFDEKSFDELVESISNAQYQALMSKCLSSDRTNFELLQKLSDIASIAKTIAGASVNWKPDFALVVNADYTGSRLPFIETDWYGKDDWSATVTFALKTTVWDGGKALRNVQRTENSVDEADIDLQSAKALVRSTVDENWTNIGVYTAQMEYQNALAMQLEDKAQQQQKLLDTGYGSQSDYLQVCLERNNCEIEILQNKINLAASCYTLLYLGGQSGEGKIN